MKLKRYVSGSAVLLFLLALFWNGSVQAGMIGSEKDAGMEHSVQKLDKIKAETDQNDLIYRNMNSILSLKKDKDKIAIENVEKLKKELHIRSIWMIDAANGERTDGSGLIREDVFTFTPSETGSYLILGETETGELLNLKEYVSSVTEFKVVE